MLDHGVGWETQYCHLHQGSVLVRTGDSVEEGQQLGLVGQSGLAQFPHVHLSVRRMGQVVDPFAPAEAGDCEAGAMRAQLWRHPIP